MIPLFAACLLVATIAYSIREYNQYNRITLTSLLVYSNFLYFALNPIIYWISPDQASGFASYISLASSEATDSGILRLLFASGLFLLCCYLSSSIQGVEYREAPLDLTESVAHAGTQVASFWVLVGIIGVIMLGFRFNGNPLGLYQIQYDDRSLLALENSFPAFLINIGKYGVAQLIVIYLMTGKTRNANIALILMTLHGIGMKSKFPIFWIIFVFFIVSLQYRHINRKTLLPLIAACIILATMSVLRGIVSFSEIPTYVAAYGSEMSTSLFTPWNNDLPGPSALTYHIIDAKAPWTIAPLTEVFTVLIPKSFLDRPPLIADLWAERIMGVSWQPGLGMGWSLIADGVLLMGWTGVMAIGMAIAWVGKRLDNAIASDGNGLLTVIACSVTPLFFYSVRENFGGFIKQALIMLVLLWIPTWLLARNRACATAQNHPQHP